MEDWRGERLTCYDHMNKGGFPIKIDIDQLADLIVAENYGFKRMVVALCRAARRQCAMDQARYDANGNGDVKATSPLADAIEEAVKSGRYY